MNKQKDAELSALYGEMVSQRFFGSHEPSTNKQDVNVNNRWIPVNKPPKDAKFKIITFAFDGKRESGVAYYLNGWHQVNGDKAWDNIIAWQPLPQAYKGE